MKPSVRVLLDSNIYGMIVEQDYVGEFTALAGRNSHVIFWGNSVIRAELKDTPKHRMHRGRKKRALLLQFYDSLVDLRQADVAENTEELAKEYFSAYRGGASWAKIKNDFLIVASASITGLDIVVSGDNKTMCSPPAKKAYLEINKLKSFRTPEFYSFEELESMLNE